MTAIIIWTLTVATWVAVVACFVRGLVARNEALRRKRLQELFDKTFGKAKARCLLRREVRKRLGDTSDVDWERVMESIPDRIGRDSTPRVL